MAQAVWFVGAYDGGRVDKADEMISGGYWQHFFGPKDKGIEKVRKAVSSIAVGDLLVIKKAFTRKVADFRTKPFYEELQAAVGQAGQEQVSVMQLVAVGEVMKSDAQGNRVSVHWKRFAKPREWILRNTYQPTINKVERGNGGTADLLVDFVLGGEGELSEEVALKLIEAKRQDFRPRTQPTKSPASNLSTPEPTTPVAQISPKSYGIANITDEGCFVDHEKLASFLEALQKKRNVILQGPPGTGKTWLARRLAYAAIGERNDLRVRRVQFHQSMSYEDFVRGWRPIQVADGSQLALKDGVFLRAINEALADSNELFAIIIEEINRGVPAQIFGELLTLIEGDKRQPDEAIELVYRDSDEERVYVPENLLVIGTMNLADRSLSMVDFALRRRFAFLDLEPCFGEPWLDWLESYGISRADARNFGKRVSDLNDVIGEEKSLGKQFCIGHSFVTPTKEVGNAQSWFEQIVQSEITPLLHEYWFDDPERATKLANALVE